MPFYRNLLTSSLLLLAIVSKALSAREFTAASPKEVEAAAAAAQPGDVIRLRDGEWHEADILLEAEGTPEKPITLKAGTPGRVVISGESRLRIAGRHLVVDGLYFKQAYNDDHLIVFRESSKKLASHCRLTNCAIVDCNTPDAANESRWISLFGDHNRIDHCWIEGKTTKGTTVAVFLDSGPAHHRIDHNYFGHRPDFEKNGGETIRVGDSKTSSVNSHVVVERNLFEQCNGEAEIISSKSCENIYRQNVFLRCSGALTLRHGHRCVVEGNWFLGEKDRGTGGVRIIGEGHQVINNYFANLTGDDHRAALSIMEGISQSPESGYEAVRTATIAFNTFVDCEETIVIGLTDEDAETDVPPANCTIANNLIRCKRLPVDIRTQMVDFLCRSNLVETEEPMSDIKGFRQVSDLKLRQDEHGLWRPLGESPAIGAAADVAEVETDIDGQLRNPPRDVGCDELVRDSKSLLPLDTGQFGPSWRMEQSK